MASSYPCPHRGQDAEYLPVRREKFEKGKTDLDQMILSGD